VLLKNDGALPFDAARVKIVAVLGALGDLENVTILNVPAIFS
jgi:hypothetical protein